MKKVLLSLAILGLLAGPAMARDFTSASSVGKAPEAGRADVVLQYDGLESGTLFGYGTSPGWLDECCVNFAAPAGGPWALVEAQFYMIGEYDHPCKVWGLYGLDQAPVVPLGQVVFTAYPAPFLDPLTGYPIIDWTYVDLTSLGFTYNEAELFGLGTTFDGVADGIGLCYASMDGLVGYSWAVYYGVWGFDSVAYDCDYPVRAGLNGGGTPAEDTSWGGVKALYR